MTPLNYFQMFWKDEINTLIADQTNLYSFQKNTKSINTTDGEIEQLIGMQMLMPVINLPAYRMYWAVDTRYPPIADVMTRNRYMVLREYLHVSDNSKKDEEGNKDNKLYKIQPVLDHVRNNCTTIEPEIEQSIDEQIIPAKTKYGGIRQYNPKKPMKWGFKILYAQGLWVLCMTFDITFMSVFSSLGHCISLHWEIFNLRLIFVFHSYYR